MSEIVVTDYDPRWPVLFEELAAPVRVALADLGADVEHVGSTSVPGLRAKPVIDIDVVLQVDADVDTAIRRLSALGYVHVGDQGIPGREAFTWPVGTPRHHLYTVTADNQAHRDHVDFRDYLRAHPATAKEYVVLKDHLAVKYRTNRLSYLAGKAAFISKVLDAARQ